MRKIFLMGILFLLMNQYAFSNFDLLAKSYSEICNESFGENTYGDKENCYCLFGYEWNSTKTSCSKTESNIDKIAVKKDKTEIENSMVNSLNLSSSNINSLNLIFGKVKAKVSKVELYQQLYTYDNLSKTVEDFRNKQTIQEKINILNYLILLIEKEQNSVLIKVTDNLYSQYFFNKGYYLGELGKYEEAILMYNKTIELDPNNKDVYFKKGYSLVNLGKYEEAILMFNRVIELDSNNINVYNDKGACLGLLGKYEEAILMFNKAIELDPNNKDSYYFKGLTLRELGKYEESILMYNKLIELYPNFENSYLELSISLEKVGKIAEAKIMYNKYIELLNSN